MRVRSQGDVMYVKWKEGNDDAWFAEDKRKQD